MKNYLIIILIFWLLSYFSLGLFLYKKINDTQKKYEKSLTKTNEPFFLNTSNLKIAIVDVEYLLKNYSFYKDLENILIQKQKKLEQEFQKEVTDLERDIAQFQKKVQTGSFLSLESAKAQEQELLERQKNLFEKREEYLRIIAEEQQKLEKQLYDTIINVLKLYEFDKKFSIIINKSSLLIANDTLNISDTLIKILNNRYQKTKKLS